MTNSPESTYRQLRFGTPVPTEEYFKTLPPEVITRIYHTLGFLQINMSPIDFIIVQMLLYPYSTTKEINKIFDSIIMEDNDK